MFVGIGVEPLICVNNQVINCLKNMAGVLSAQYQSVFSLPQYMENEPYSFFPDEQDTPTTMALLSFLDNELRGAMREPSENTMLLGRMGLQPFF